MATDGALSTSQTGTRTLRVIVAVVAVLLVAAVAGFILSGRAWLHHYLSGLPKHLGVDIEQETNNFTISQSLKGKKIFTLHASKEVQRKDGKISLHDVGIVLYGSDGRPSDEIHGADFEYDQKAQRLLAKGVVYIDLVAFPAPGPSAGDAETRTVHVKTTGLDFDQKEQTAISDGAVEFRSGAFSGNAIGANYNARLGKVVLLSSVRMSGLRASGVGAQRPVVLTAARAEMDRPTNVLNLQNAKYISTSDRGAESAAAARAVVHTTADGTPQRVDAEGDVTLVADGRGTVHAKQMEVDLGYKGQAKAAHLFGDVQYRDEQEGERTMGSADDARIAFDDVGRPAHAVFVGTVNREANFVAEGASGRRQLDGSRIEVGLGGEGKEPLVVREAVATGPGGGRLMLLDRDASGQRETDTRADRLVGRFAARSKTTELSGLDGAGHTWVQRIALDSSGSELSKDESTGDNLRLDFKPDGANRSELAAAEQRGNVATVHEAVPQTGPRKGTRKIVHSRGDEAAFDAKTNVLRMSGAVMVQDETNALFADRVEIDRTSGDAQANGSVRVSYVGEDEKGKNAEEPVHVIAARAVAHKSAGVAEFYADAGGNVRMWQGGSQVEAPMIELDRTGKRMVARGIAGSSVPSVRTLLTSEGKKDNAAKKGPGPLRVLSRELVYTDAARTVEFKGLVHAVDADGTMTARDATVWLSAADAAATPARGEVGMMNGKVDHLIATGEVSLNQPGRTGTGDKLVYTAGDGVFVLTGTKAKPPKVVDAAQGSTTGGALRFRTGNDSVEVLGSVDGQAAGRVRSETRMKE